MSDLVFRSVPCGPECPSSQTGRVLLSSQLPRLPGYVGRNKREGQASQRAIRMQQHHWEVQTGPVVSMQPCREDISCYVCQLVLRYLHISSALRNTLQHSVQMVTFSLFVQLDNHLLALWFFHALPRFLSFYFFFPSVAINYAFGITAYLLWMRWKICCVFDQKLPDYTYGVGSVAWLCCVKTAERNITPKNYRKAFGVQIILAIWQEVSLSGMPQAVVQRACTSNLEIRK